MSLADLMAWPIVAVTTWRAERRGYRLSTTTPREEAMPNPA